MIPKKIWGEIIKDFQEKELPELVERDIKYSLRSPLKRATVFIGPRRSGKTYLMFQSIKKLFLEGVEKNKILYVNFEDSRLIGATITDLNNMLDVFFELYSNNGKTWVFLDEIQIIENWEKFVRTLLDKENSYVFVTGSSSKLMSREIATSLRGRSLTYHVFPFSFIEFLKANKLSYSKYLSTSERARIIRSLKEYTEYGGYPEVIFYKQEREKILREIIDVTIYRDIVERHKVKNVKLLKIFFTALFNSKEFSIHKFFNFLKTQGMKISKNTLYNYFEYFVDSLVVYNLRKFSYSYKNIEASTSKIYFVDNGLLFLQGVREYGRLIENLVFIELKRREDLFYYKSSTSEVDFVLKDGSKVKQLIQVCYSIENFNTKEREIKALLKASKELRCRNLLIITWDYEGEEIIDKKKIKYIPLWKWLL